MTKDDLRVKTSVSALSRRFADQIGAVFAVAAAAAVLSAQTAPPNRPPAPTRDTPAQIQAQAAAATGRISGRVIASDTGRPIRRARVGLTVNSPGNQIVLTDDNGRFSFADLPAGRYTVSASRPGFVTLSYGQRRPLQPGTPIQLAEAQQLTNIDISLPRGSVVSGHVSDEAGEPLPGATVRVLRLQSNQGIRRLTPAGAGETDDRGEFRIWGLNPGEYYVSAVSRALSINGPNGGRNGAAGGRGAGGRGAGGRGGGPSNAAFGQGISSDEPEPISFAPTYYPGVPAPESARAVSVGLSAEVLNVDFSLLVVRTARISGRAITPDGSPLTGGAITLLPAVTLSRSGDVSASNMAVDGTLSGGMSMPYSSRVAGDGAFSLGNVPPGRYILQARVGGGQRAPLYAEQALTVAETNIENLAIVLSPGATITGTIAFRATKGTPAPNLNQVRIAAPSVDLSFTGGPARVTADGRFTLEGVSPGGHWIRSQSETRGWILESVIAGGRETIDTPIEVRGGQAVTGITLTFTDRLTEINGTLSDAQNGPVPDFTVLAFPTDSDLWRPQSRYIATTRPDQNGRFQLRGLPQGNYFVVPIDPTQPGEWYDPSFLEAHQERAARISLSEGETRTQDFKLAPQ